MQFNRRRFAKPSVPFIEDHQIAPGTPAQDVLCIVIEQGLGHGHALSLDMNRHVLPQPDLIRGTCSVTWLLLTVNGASDHGVTQADHQGLGCHGIVQRQVTDRIGP